MGVAASSATLGHTAKPWSLWSRAGLKLSVETRFTWLSIGPKQAMWTLALQHWAITGSYYT